jgi:hypothetical protein
MPRTLARVLILVCLVAAGRPQARDALWVRGMTVSTHRSGQEWYGDEFARELEALARLGANWVAVHPYATIAADGTVDGSRGLGLGGAEGLAAPIRAAHARGLSILIVPHLAHWGSPFEWRGAIDFAEPEARARFFESYGAWIVALARQAREADAFSVGSELDRLAGDEGPWRALIADVRALTGARLTYAANWDAFERVGFWDALDAVGVQGYFPLCDEPQPQASDLAAGWARAVARLRAVHLRTGKPIVLTELGYDASPSAAREPWRNAQRLAPQELEQGRALQQACLEAAFAALERERDWLRGAFLWKWFVGGGRREDFALDSAPLRELVGAAWSDSR